MNYQLHRAQQSPVVSQTQDSQNTVRDLVLPVGTQPQLTQLTNHTTSQTPRVSPVRDMNGKTNTEHHSILRNLESRVNNAHHLAQTMPTIGMLPKHPNKNTDISVDYQFDYSGYDDADLSITKHMNVQKKTQNLAHKNDQQLEQKQVVMQHVFDNNITPIPVKQVDNKDYNTNIHNNNQNNNHNNHHQNNNNNANLSQSKQQLSSQELNKLQIACLEKELTLCDQLYAQVQKALVQFVATQQISTIQTTTASPPSGNETIFFTQNLYAIIDQVLRDGQEQVVICKNTPTGSRGHKLRSRLAINVATARHIKQHGLIMAYNQDVFPVSSEDLWIELRILRSRQDSLMLQLMHLNAAASFAQVTHCTIGPK